MTSDSNDGRTAVASAVAAATGEFLTVAECAGILRVTRQTIYGDIEQGLIRDVIRVGARYRVPVDAFREYVNSLKVTTPATGPNLALTAPSVAA